MSDKVSIIVPIYNTERFLRQCLDSIIIQTHHEIEILLIDDGSTDSSGKICDEYAKEDGRINVIHQKNMGLSGARNTGIKNAHGVWLTIVDSDDWLEKDAIEKMLEKANEDSNCDVFIASFYTSHPDGERVDSFFKLEHIVFNKDNMKLLQMSCLCTTAICKENAATNVGVTWARLYRTDFIKSNGLQFKVGLKRMQDAVFHLTAYEYAREICFVNMPVYHYRVWNGSASRKYAEDFDSTAQEIIDEIEKYIERFSPGDEFMRCYYTKIIKLLLETIKLTYASPGNSLSQKEKIKNIRAIMKRQRYRDALKYADIKMLSNRQKGMYILLKLHLVGVVLRVYSL